MDIPLAMAFSSITHHSRDICRWPCLTMVTDHRNHTRTSRTQYYQASWLASGLGLLATTGYFGFLELNTIKLLVRASCLASGLWLPSNHWVFWGVLGSVTSCVVLMVGCELWLDQVTRRLLGKVDLQTKLRWLLGNSMLHNKVANSD